MLINDVKSEVQFKKDSYETHDSILVSNSLESKSDFVVSSICTMKIASFHAKKVEFNLDCKVSKLFAQSVLGHDDDFCDVQVVDENKYSPFIDSYHLQDYADHFLLWLSEHVSIVDELIPRVSHKHKQHIHLADQSYQSAFIRSIPPSCFPDRSFSFEDRL